MKASVAAAGAAAAAVATAAAAAAAAAAGNAPKWVGREGETSPPLREERRRLPGQLSLLNSHGACSTFSTAWSSVPHASSVDHLGGKVGTLVSTRVGKPS